MEEERGGEGVVLVARPPFHTAAERCESLQGVQMLWPEEIRALYSAKDVESMVDVELKEEVRELRKENAVLRREARLADQRAEEKQRHMLLDAKKAAAMLQVRLDNAIKELDEQKRRLAAEYAASLDGELRKMSKTMADLKEAAVAAGCWQRLSAACKKLSLESGSPIPFPCDTVLDEREPVVETGGR